jgi:hypothetical protein
MPKIPFICKNCGKADSCDTENNEEKPSGHPAKM